MSYSKRPFHLPKFTVWVDFITAPAWMHHSRLLSRLYRSLCIFRYLNVEILPWGHLIQLVCVCYLSFVWCWDFQPVGAPGSTANGREWELGKRPMFCWRMCTEGLKEQFCGQSQHPASQRISPVIIGAIIEAASWPLKSSSDPVL